MGALGAIAGIATAVCWAITSILFTSAGKALGSLVVNRARLLLAVLFLLVVHTVLVGSPLPIGVSWDHWLWLGLSGIVGLTLGDLFLFQSYVMIGPRLGTLIMAVAPVISALLAWLFLGERLNLIEITGICVTVAGIAWVVMERPGGPDRPHDARHYLLGLLCAFGGALGQAGGLILSKMGLAGDFNPISGTIIRMIAAAVTIWLFTLFSGQARSTVSTVRSNLPVLRTMVLGVAVGPVLGVWLSMVSVQLAPVGIASTLMALTPILLLPFAGLLYKEKVSLRAIAGTVLSIVGVVVLFMS